MDKTQISIAEIKKDIKYLGDSNKDLKDSNKDLVKRFDEFEDVMIRIREEQATQRERQRYWNYGLGLLNTVLTVLVGVIGLRNK